MDGAPYPQGVSSFYAHTFHISSSRHSAADRWFRWRRYYWLLSFPQKHQRLMMNHWENRLSLVTAILSPETDSCPGNEMKWSNSQHWLCEFQDTMYMYSTLYEHCPTTICKDSRKITIFYNFHFHLGKTEVVSRQEQLTKCYHCFPHFPFPPRSTENRTFLCFTRSLPTSVGKNWTCLTFELGIFNSATIH